MCKSGSLRPCSDEKPKNPSVSFVLFVSRTGLHEIRNYVTPRSSPLREPLQGIPSHCVEPRGFLQQFRLFPYPETDQAIPGRHIPLSDDLFQYCRHIKAEVFQLVSFHQVSWLKPYMHLFSYPCVLHVPPISFFLIWSPELYLLSSIERKDSHDNK
jgi:hypothetical protein